MESSLTGAVLLLFLMTQISMILSESCPGAPSCLGAGNYCSGSQLGATCVDGTCQCPNTPTRDRCTCLSVIGSCHLESGQASAAATARYRGASQTAYSCVANDNCDYEVHVLGVYESTQGTFSTHPTGHPNVYITVTRNSTRPLILVLSSYEPGDWTLHIPRGVEISRVITSSYYTNTVRASDGRSLVVESSLTYTGFGSDTGGGDTNELLLYLLQRFGPVSSFTGTYSADEWRLTLNHGNPDINCVSLPTEVPTTPDPSDCSALSSPCIGSNYCPGSYRSGAVCRDGFCQCPYSSMRDNCTCLSVIGSCHIRSDVTTALATPTSLRNGYATYSCVANDNCDNEVHVLGVYQSAQGSYFTPHPTGYPDVYINVVGNSSRPLILVLSSYEPAIWTLHIPNGVVISKVLISSYYDNSIRTSGGQVLSVEDDLDFTAYGSDDGGGNTHGLLLHLYERFGPVSSFTGIYEANEWTLTLNRRDPDSGCLSGPFQLPTPSPSQAPPSQAPPLPPISTQASPQVPTSFILLALSATETQCVMDKFRLSDCASASIESICRSGDCFQTLDQMLAQCGRPNALSSACKLLRINPPTTSSSSSSSSIPISVQYVLGFGIPFFIIFFMMLLILCLKIKISSTRPPVSRTTASRPSQHLQFSLNRQPALAGASLNSASASPPYHTATKQVVTELSNAEAPPSYADLEKEEALPPPYSD